MWESTQSILELDVRAQFYDARPLVRRSLVVVGRDAANSKSAALNKRGEARCKAIIITSAPRAWLKVRVIENVQHFRLEREPDPFGNREAFREG